MTDKLDAVEEVDTSLLIRWRPQTSSPVGFKGYELKLGASEDSPLLVERC